MRQKYTTLSPSNVRWHDSSVGTLGPGSIIEAEHTDIVVVGGVKYIASGSQMNVLVNTDGSHFGLSEIIHDVAIDRVGPPTEYD